MSEKVRWLNENCVVCGRRINSWDKRCDKALAYRNPTCESCIAKEYGMESDELRQHLEEFFGMRPCVGI
ncbi:MAG: hypothetical protein ACI4KR_10340 [Ruminiclostridium sp.]